MRPFVFLLPSDVLLCGAVVISCVCSVYSRCCSCLNETEDNTARKRSATTQGQDRRWGWGGGGGGVYGTKQSGDMATT